MLGRWSFDSNGDTTLTMMSGRQIRNGFFDDANAVILTADEASPAPAAPPAGAAPDQPFGGTGR